MHSSPLKLVVFDCDGTLVDSQYNITRCMELAFNACGLTPPDHQDVRGVIGLNLDRAIHQLMEEKNDPELLDRLVGNYKAAFHDNRLQDDHEEPLFEGTLDVLEALEKAGVLMAVATGKSLRGLNAVIEMHGLQRYFTSLQTPDTNPGKPHPQMLEQAMAKVGAEAADTYMIGDTSFDMMLARNAGCHPVGVNWGYHEEDILKAAGASHILSTYPELLPLVIK
ncbi:HAD-IA family hydrolase [Sneathiella limimaris]|uniref:HAD-IA family hydrolase n=1 Tax=Sneathiella limimaris TaxID=1964213 RepID=UPI00146DBC39|nr:HAD-IA family hydrolase [Sneathiella limimaris]